MTLSNTTSRTLFQPTVTVLAYFYRATLCVAPRGLSYRNSGRLSVCLSVTLVDCVHIVRPTIMISSPYGSLMILVFEDITFISKFEGGHPERGR